MWRAFGSTGVSALGIDAQVDGIEDATNQDRPPIDLDAELLCERLDIGGRLDRSEDWNSRRRIRSWRFLCFDYGPHRGRRAHASLEG